MQNYDELLNDRKSKNPVDIQGIYDMVYAPELTVYMINNFTMGIELIDKAVSKDGTRAVVLFKELSSGMNKAITLADLDPQLREVMVIGRRFWKSNRDQDMSHDYDHFGLPESGVRLALEKNLTLPNGKRASDLAELGVAIREHLHLYKEPETQDKQ